MSTVPITLHTPRLQPQQAQKRPPTQYEALLGDAIERAFAAGHWELNHLVNYLNQSGPTPPNHALWTPEIYTAEIARLATGN